jgi:DHA1 family multidrug resistance protein-like MFS transporter
MSLDKRRTVLYILYFTVFLNSTSLGTSNFLLPVYAETLGATYSDLGRMGAVGNIAYLIITLATGYLLDRYERVNLYSLFTIGGAISVAFFAYTSTIFQVILVRGLLGVFSATFWVTASTLTADLAPPELLTRSMGRYNLAWIMGFAIGPLGGGFVINLFGYEMFFYSLGGLMLISLFIILLKFRGKITLKGKQESVSSTSKSLRRVIFAYLTLVPFTLVLGIYMAIMPGHMKVVGLTSASTGALIAMTNGVRGLSFFNVERFVDWGSRKSLFSASLFIFSSMFLVRNAVSTIEFAVPLVLYGIGAGIITPVILDFITRRMLKSALGSAMGLHEGVYGLGMCFGPLFGGNLADVYGTQTLYLILALVALTLLPLSWKMTRESA